MLTTDGWTRATKSARLRRPVTDGVGVVDVVVEDTDDVPEVRGSAR
jgi:hypothetical protein